MTNAQRVVLVHYHEIGLKGHNRSSFEKRLQKNLRALLEDKPIDRIERISGRILIELNDQVGSDDALEIAQFVSRVPGVARVSCGYKVMREMDIIIQAAIAALHDAEPFESFKVKARRAHTDFPINSMELNQLVGASLCAEFSDKAVKMKDPDVEVGVEIVQNSAFIYAFSIPGIGGLPVGVSGKLVSLLSSGIDSPVALWQMARRGARCIGVHFSGRPETSDLSEYLVDDIAHVLEKTGCILKVYVVPLGEYQRKISLNAPPKLRIILYRRLMMKVAAAIAEKESAGALITGESLGQVASQTLDNIRCTDAAVNMPIFRPLIGTDKQRIIDEAIKLGTFDISTQDAPDCCTLFMPRSPETHAKLDEVLDAESKFPIDEWVCDLAASAEIKTYQQPR